MAGADDQTDNLDDDGRRLLLEIAEQAIAGAADGSPLVEVRLSEAWNAGLHNLGQSGGVLDWAIGMLRSESVRVRLPKTLSVVRIHWPPGWGSDDIPMKPASTLN